jgi:hypothetical protein
MRLRKTLIVSAIAIVGINTDVYGGICQPCPPGTYSGGGNASSCTTCEEGNYCVNGQKNPCPSGYDCPVGASTPTPDTTLKCGYGEYLKNTNTCAPCPAGTYMNVTLHKNTNCTVCPSPGFAYSSGGATICSICLPPKATNTSQTACGKYDGNTLRSGNVKASGWTFNASLTEGKCHSINAGNSIANPSGSGSYCYCRAKTSNGASSSWGYVNAFFCASNCGSSCANTSNFDSYWGARASW